jgi:hypothetical protein
MQCLQVCGLFHGSIVALNEFDTFEEDTLQKALEFYKTKHPKH